MLKTGLGLSARLGHSPLLCLVLAGTTLLAVACGADDASSKHRLRNGQGDGDGSGAGGNGGGANNGDSNNPETPTNQGPEHNAAGFTALAPLLRASCSECHHAGTWLDLTKGADAGTADKMIHSIEQGTMPPAPRTPLAASALAKMKTWRDGGVPEAIVPSDLPGTSQTPSSAAITQVLSGATLAAYKAALPNVAWPRLSEILKSPSTLFWDKAAIPPAYQDTVGDGAGLPLGARFNNAGKGLIVPEGKKLFSDDGKTWSFPFGHTAGADDSANAVIVDFMSLPVSADGAMMPITYKIETGSTGGLPIKRWNWSFPKGTIVGEIIMVRDGASLLTTEIRVRERFSDTWATNSFRPFPTAKIMSAAIKQRRPSWQSSSELSSLVAALENTASLQSKRVGSPAFSELVSLDGFIDAPLPSANDDDLVRDLLKSTTFVGAYGTAWKQNGTQRSFGITGPASGSLSVVPSSFEAGLLEVRETTCEKCHNQGGYFIGDLVDQAVLYGDIWGVDRIFSFHPFDPARIDASGNENRSVRSELTSIVVPYDASKHPSSTYTFYRPAVVP